MDQSSTSDPPDGGWGWVMVGAAFLCHILGGAVYGSLGVIYISWLDEFGLGNGTTSWIISLAFGVLFCIGPVASTLINKFGCRSVAVAGSIMASGGLIVCYWASSVPYLIFFIGVVSGAGSGMTYIPCVVVVTSYFKKNLSLATGIYASGAGLGNFIMAPLVNHLDDVYGWRGALLITGALVFHTCAASLLFTPYDMTIDDSKSDEPLLTDCVTSSTCSSDDLTKAPEGEGICNDHTSANDLDNFPMNKSLTAITDRDKIIPHNMSKSVIDNSSTGLPPSLKNDPDLIIIKSIDNTIVDKLIKDDTTHDSVTKASSSYSIKDTKSVAGQTPFLTTFPHSSAIPKSVQCLKTAANEERAFSSLNDVSNRKNGIFQIHNSLAKSCSNQKIYKSLRNLDLHILGSVRDLFDKNNLKDKDDKVSLMNEEFNQSLQGTESGIEPMNNEITIKKGPMCPSLNFKIPQSLESSIELLRDGTFLVLFISNFFTCLSYTSPVIFMVDRAVDNGIDKSMASALISITGIGNIVGRLLFGIIADRYFKKPLLLYIGIISINGLSTMMSSLCGGHLVLHGIYAFVYGTSIGAFAVLAVVVTVDLMGRERVALAFGLYLLTAGVGSVLGPPLGGWLFDWTKTYTLTFIMTGLFTFFSAVILIPLYVFQRCHPTVLPVHSCLDK